MSITQIHVFVCIVSLTKTRRYWNCLKLILILYFVVWNVVEMLFLICFCFFVICVALIAASETCASTWNHYSIIQIITLNRGIYVLFAIENCNIFRRNRYTTFKFHFIINQNFRIFNRFWLCSSIFCFLANANR